MSIALLITPATTSNFHPLHNYENKSHFPRTELGFVRKKDTLELSVLKIETNPKSKFFISAQALVHKVCKCFVGFTSVAAKCGAASSFDFNINDFGDYEGRVDLETKEAVPIAGSDSNIGSGGGPGNSDGGGGGGGGGDNTGNGGDGPGESGGWEGVKCCCWWLFEAWKKYYLLGYPSSTVTLSRIALPIIQEIVGSMVETELQAILMPLFMALFLPIFMLPVVAFSGLIIAIEQSVLFLAIGVLGIVLVILFLFWEFSQHRNL